LIENNLVAKSLIAKSRLAGRLNSREQGLGNDFELCGAVARLESHQAIEGGTIAPEGEAQVFGGDFRIAVPLLDELFALGEKGLHEGGHGFLDELIGALDGALRVVDEIDLQSIPMRGEDAALFIVEERAIGGAIRWRSDFPLLVDGLHDIAFVGD
jgi:hypothetical protein